METAEEKATKWLIDNADKMVEMLQPKFEERTAVISAEALSGLNIEDKDVIVRKLMEQYETVEIAYISDVDGSIIVEITF